MNDIASVEILIDASRAAVYGAKAGGAVIVITTKMGDDDIANIKTVQHFGYYSPAGYYKARVFYSPAYEALKTKIPYEDKRTTIYWNPEIITDKNGKASFEFFNADDKGTYRLLVEGIDNNGNIIRNILNYKVE